MACKMHFALLKEAIEAGLIEGWNNWRKEHPEIRPDLSDADLRYEELRHADLSWAKLSRADLTDALLIGPDEVYEESHRIVLRPFPR
jgi:uncharacterized protein YjbI with pentapeptide repeats